MELTERLELAETEMLAGLSKVPPAIGEQLGISTQRVGQGIALVVGNDPTDYWSQAHGLGFDRPLDGEVVAEVLEFTQAADGRAMNFHVAPAVLPADWDDICAKYGLSRGSTMVKTARAAAPVAKVETDLRIEPLGAEDVDAFVAIQVAAFEVSDEIGAMLGAFTHMPGVTVYGAWDGDTLAGTGVLVVVGEVAELVSGATLPAYRGRGAQSALMARRLEDAYAAGCLWAAAETGKPGPGEHNSSLANMQRAGLEVVYERPIYSWRAE
ncbi:GNAT family N-acetyltransferase [Kribbella sandramycini]|uniref:GNAT family N-acetyltransferase n=1 Tax=Kribbella sandramycini TaxID=60450 RepID=A0A7Y4NZZ4_9ACTN|nr:GNAT family N-acetyltransferase [Kribbella sandramycini]MBB6569571.1 GNAT superfamily N-acetyltransferase [Kribbella sandramycini]NOL40595.1 GNAT family N-acetyltransferase [Kribbella sandramycini]